MTKYTKIVLKRLYGNKASVRDYVWKDCIKKGYGIEFICMGATMKIPPHKLLIGEQGGETFKSKFGSEAYKLIDFKWEGDRVETRHS